IDSVRKAQRGESAKQVHLRNAKFDVLALRREFPIEGGWDALAFKRVRQSLAGKQTSAIDPWPQTRRNRNVGRSGNDARGERRVVAAKLIEQCAEAELRGCLRLDGYWQFVRHSDAFGLQIAVAAACKGYTVKEGLNLWRRVIEPFEARPFLTGTYIHRLSKRLHLRRRHQTGVVVLVPGERQAIAFDRVCDEANRPVVIDRIESGN